MRIMGIEIKSNGAIGFGIVDRKLSKLNRVQFGYINSIESLEAQLTHVHESMIHILKEYNVDAIVFQSSSNVAVERLKGVIIQTATYKATTIEYNLNEVKQSIAGYEKASDQEVYKMIKTYLKIQRAPDITIMNALGLAICHAHVAARSTQREMIREITPESMYIY